MLKKDGATMSNDAMKKPLTTSVAMTTYNSAKYLGAQLNSILKQTVLPDEIVICDDGSSDNTAQIVEQYTGNGKVPIHYWVNEKNLGVTRNFEQCYLKCKGDIIFSCDADDIWLENKIATMVSQFDDDQVVLVYSDAVVVDQDENVLIESLNSTWDKRADKDNTEEFLLMLTTRVGQPNGMQLAFRRSILEECCPFYGGFDSWLTMNALLLGRVVCVPEVLVKWRRHTATVSNRREGYIEKIRKTSKEGWFLYAACMAEEREVFLRKFDRALPDKVKETLEASAKYWKAMEQITNSSKFGSLWGLINLYRNGMYTTFRGNHNMLMYDLLFTLIKG